MSGRQVPEARPDFDSVWGKEDFSGWKEDVEATLEDLRAVLAADPGTKVRLRVGTRQFGEAVLAGLSGDEDGLARVTVVLSPEGVAS